MAPVHSNKAPLVLVEIDGHEQPRPNDLTFDEVSRAMDEFVRAQGWYKAESSKPQTPRNLAMSMAIEVAELLECFQWSEPADLAAVEDELADVVLYAVQLAKVAGVDIGHSILAKLERNQHRRWDSPRQDRS